jgi:hypothetical protein
MWWWYCGIDRISLSFPSSIMSTKVIVIPTLNDVIMGRGKRIDVHPGNVAFRHLIWTHRAAYVSAGRNTQRKRDVIEWVVNEVINGGGRFVKVGPSGKYDVVSVLQAMEKTAQALREKHMKKPPNMASASLKIATASSSSYKTLSLKAPVSKAAKASKRSIKRQTVSSKKTTKKSSATTITTTSLNDMLLSYDPRSDDELFGEWLMENRGVSSSSGTGHRVTLQCTATTYSAIKQTRTPGTTTTHQASKAGHRSTTGICTTNVVSSSPFVHSDIMDKDAAASSRGVTLGVNGINTVPDHENFKAIVDNGSPPLVCPLLAQAAAVAALPGDPNWASSGTKEPLATVPLSLASMKMNPLWRNDNTTATSTVLPTASLVSLAAEVAEYGAHRWGNSSDAAVMAFEHLHDHGANGDANLAFRHSDDHGLGGNPPAIAETETMECSDPSSQALWDPNLAYLWFYPLDSSSESHPLLHDESDSDDSDLFDPLKVWHTLLPAPPDHATPSPLSRD